MSHVRHWGCRFVIPLPSVTVLDCGSMDAAIVTGDRLDVAVIGGGIVGLATAHQLLRDRPGLRLAVIEKEPELARTSRGTTAGSSTPGLYYAPGSLKAKLCREGKGEVERFAETHGIPFRHPGKLVVALSEAELPRFEALRARAEANGVEGLKVVGPDRIRELEPEAPKPMACSRRGPGSSNSALAGEIAEEVRGGAGGSRPEARSPAWPSGRMGSCCRRPPASSGLTTSSPARVSTPTESQR